MGLGRSPRKGIKGTSAIRKVKLSSRSERAQTSAERSPNMAKTERSATRREEKKQKRKNLRELARAKEGGPDLDAMRALGKRGKPDDDGDGDSKERKPSRLERRSIQAAKRAKKNEEKKKEEKPVEVSEEESESSSSEEEEVEIVSKPKTAVKADDDEADGEDESDDESDDDDDNEKVDVDEKVDDDEEARDESQPSSDDEAVDDDSDSEVDDDEEDDLENDGERMERTLFIGNVPLSAKRRQMKSLVSKFGKVESIRFRGVIPENPNISKKQALLTGRFHRNVDSLEVYAVFKKPKDGDCEGLLKRASKELNLRVLDGKHLRVNPALGGIRSGRSSIFVGNLPLDVTEELLFKTFENALKDSGSHVVGARVERDRRTGLGRGFGFVSFNDLLGVKFALASAGKIFVKNRVLRMERAESRLKGNTQAFKNQQRLASGRVARKKHSNAPKQKLSKRQKKQQKKEKNANASAQGY